MYMCSVLFNNGLKLFSLLYLATYASSYSLPGLTCSRKRTLFASTVLAAVITVTAKYLSFVGSTMVRGQGWPAMPLV